MEPGGFVPGGGLPSGATNMSQLAPGVWGWAGADSVASHPSALDLLAFLHISSFTDEIHEIVF